MGGFSSGNIYSGTTGSGQTTGSPMATSDPSGYEGTLQQAAGPTGGNGTFGYMTLAGLGNEQQTLALDALGQAENISGITSPALTGYAQFLNAMTSSDPATRTAAAAPAIQTEEQQQSKARQNIAANTPRGGAQNYLEGQSYIQEAGDISGFINNAWLSAEQQQGQLGEWGTQATQQGLGLSESGLGGAAGTTGSALNLKYGVKSANEAASSAGIDAILGALFS
jgi:hypothetical protein